MLNKEQQLAVDSNSKLICCLAGAGAGKSKSLLARIDRLIKEGVLPSQILALTFTNAASAEMQERFELAHVGMLSPEFRTFHSFSYSLLCKDVEVRRALGYDKVPDIASDEFEREIRDRAKAQCKITLSSEKLLKRKNLTRNELRMVELYDKAINRLMKQEGVITFDMLNSEVSKLFSAHHSSIIKYLNQYKYIHIDEFQDIDGIQLAFLKAFTDSNIFVVGDCLQNIYAFRGCTNEYIKNITYDPDWKKIKLFENYRSTTQICEYANKFSATYADEEYRITMHGNKEGKEVIEREIEGPDNYDAIAVSDIELMLKDIDGLSGTTAILCRSNKEVSEVCNYLKAKGIDYTSRKETVVVKLIECALSDEYMIGYLASHLTSAKYGEFIRLSPQHSKDIKWFLSTYGDVKDISSDSKKIMALRDIASLNIEMKTKIEMVSNVLKLKHISTPNDNPFGIGFLEWLRDTVSEIKTNELYVGTIHSAKGLEYDNVCVANVGAYMFQLGDEEMNNLFYVAITRAKNRLFVYRV